MNPLAKIPEQELISFEISRGFKDDPSIDDVTKADFQKIWDTAVSTVPNIEETPINRVVVLRDGLVVPVVPFGGFMDRIKWIPLPFVAEPIMKFLTQAVAHRLEEFVAHEEESYTLGRVCRVVPTGHEVWGVYAEDYDTFCRIVMDFGNVYGGVSLVQKVFYLSSPGVPGIAVQITVFLSEEAPHSILKPKLIKDFGSTKAFETKLVSRVVNKEATWQVCPDAMWADLQPVLEPSWRGDLERMVSLLCPLERWSRN